MDQVANAIHYVLAVERTKNRVYWTPRGLWTEGNPDGASLIADWDKALQLVSQRFTILTDATQVKPIPKEMLDLFSTIQSKAIAAGLLGSAEIFPPEAATVQVQTKHAYEKSGMNTRIFTNRLEAEEWLTSLE